MRRRHFLALAAAAALASMEKPAAGFGITLIPVEVATSDEMQAPLRG